MHSPNIVKEHSRQHQRETGFQGHCLKSGRIWNAALHSANELSSEQSQTDRIHDQHQCQITARFQRGGSMQLAERSQLIQLQWSRSGAAARGGVALLGW